MKKRVLAIALVASLELTRSFACSAANLESPPIS